MATQLMKAQGPYLQYQAQDGSVYTSDASGYIPSVDSGDVLSLISAGCLAVTMGSNLTATAAPTATDDSTKDYAVGSRWIYAGTEYVCVDATASAAVWVTLSPVTLIGRLRGANFNITTDQQIPLFVPATAKFRVTKITVFNTSVAGMSTAAGGVYPAASKAGTAVVAAGQVYTGLTNAATALDLTLAGANAIQAAAVKLYLSLTTGQGAAATADINVYGDVYA